MTRLTVVSITLIVVPVINKSIHITSVVTFWPHIIHIFNWQTKTTTWNLFDNRTWIVAFVINIFSNEIWSPILKIQIRRWWIEQKMCFLWHAACNCSLAHKMKATKMMDILMERLNSFNALHSFKYECLSIYARCTVCYCFFSFCHRTKNMLRQTTTNPICNGDFNFVFERCTSWLGCIMGWCVWIVKHRSTKVHITWESICWKKNKIK